MMPLLLTTAGDWFESWLTCVGTRLPDISLLSKVESSGVRSAPNFSCSCSAVLALMLCPHSTKPCNEEHTFCLKPASNIKKIVSSFSISNYQSDNINNLGWDSKITYLLVYI